ncbi:hypothetical protein GBA52_028301 [Prunus armeniaca]|nr:hypothetical protein GBA52_028301 [Prunus armeniaca]
MMNLFNFSIGTSSDFTSLWTLKLRKQAYVKIGAFFVNFKPILKEQAKVPRPFHQPTLSLDYQILVVILSTRRQEDAHELMRFAIDTMQSVCLVSLVEKAAYILALKRQPLFNIYLVAWVTTSGDASSLEECLDQFTIKECLDGENKSRLYIFLSILPKPPLSSDLSCYFSQVATGFSHEHLV